MRPWLKPTNNQPGYASNPQVKVRRPHWMNTSLAARCNRRLVSGMVEFESIVCALKVSTINNLARLQFER